MCDEAGSEVLFDETTALGFSAADAAPLVSEPSSDTLGWIDGAVATTAEGTTEVRVEVALSETARFEERSFADSTVLKDGALADACNDRLAFDATLTLTTSDGQLDEVIETTLYAEDTDRVTANVRLPVDQLAGDLEVSYSYTPDRYDLEQSPELWVSLQFDDHGCSGSVTAAFAYAVEGDSVPAYFAAPIGKWPAGDP